jgi:hypothetical protein
LPDETAPHLPTRSKGKLFAGLAVIAIAGLGSAYYFGYMRAGPADTGSGAAVSAVSQDIIAPEMKLFYAATQARLRDQPAITGSNITGKLLRGDDVSGSVVNGTAAGELWLKLADDKGFVNLVNLSEAPAPALQKKFGQKIVALPAAARLLKTPARNGEIAERLPQGTAVTVSGITDNGYLEVIRKTGGVGYIAGGVEIIADSEKPDLPPVIAIKIDANGCAAGPEIEAVFKQIQNRQAAGLRAVEEAKYPNDDARDAAIARYRQRNEGRSITVPLNRSFRGLTVTGVGVHPESQSVYFSETPDQVRAAFRGAGYRVGRDGKLPSREIYASIDAGNSKLGKTDMGCGV